MINRQLLKTLWEKEKLLVTSNFSFFPQCFQLNQIIVLAFGHVFDIKSLFATELEEPKIEISGKGLRTPFLNSLPNNLWSSQPYK